MTMTFIASLNGLGVFSNIPQTFAHLEMRIFGRSTESGSTVNMYARFNSDGTTSYVGHQLSGNGSGASSSAYLGYDAWEIGSFPASSATANVFANHIIRILDYSNSTKFKTMMNIFGYDLNGSGDVSLKSGLWRNTAAITSINFTYPPVATGTRIDLYGIGVSEQTGF